MPDLNVQQNNANIIKALRNALAIGQIKGPIASDGNDNFTSIGSNRNLLDNWYFVGGGSQLGDGVFPINQRGLTSYTASGACIDRWKTDGGFTLSASGISQDITKAAYQMVTKEFIDRLYGKTLTMSLMLTDGTIKSGTFAMPSAYTGVTTVLSAVSDGSHYIGLLIYDTGNGQICRTMGNNIAAVKLEVGTVSTLANDVPPDFGEELRKCQRYLWVLDIPSYFLLGEFAMAGDATNGSFVLHTPVEMARTSPLVTITGDLQISGVGAITGIPWATKFEDRVYVAFVTSGTMIANTIYPIGAGQSARITVSAEL